MGQILIRNLESAVLTRLKRRAKSQGLSLAASVRRVLSAPARRPTEEDLLAQMRRIRDMSPRRTKRPFAEDLIREGRDER